MNVVIPLFVLIAVFAISALFRKKPLLAFTIGIAGAAASVNMWHLGCHLRDETTMTLIVPVGIVTGLVAGFVTRKHHAHHIQS